MKPRHVTLLLMIVLGAVLAPLVADAQAPTKVARIGWMSRGNPTASDPAMDAFRQGMRELGYVEGQTFVMEPRYAGGKRELMPEQAAELERAGVDVIITGPFEALQAAKQSTSHVPIIMTPSADPVATGIVKSLDRPGGNITGITEMMPELTPQRLTLLQTNRADPEPCGHSVAAGHAQRRRVHAHVARDTSHCPFARRTPSGGRGRKGRGL